MEVTQIVSILFCESEGDVLLAHDTSQSWKPLNFFCFLANLFAYVISWGISSSVFASFPTLGNDETHAGGNVILTSPLYVGVSKPVILIYSETLRNKTESRVRKRETQ